MKLIMVRHRQSEANKKGMEEIAKKSKFFKEEILRIK